MYTIFDVLGYLQAYLQVEPQNSRFAAVCFLTAVLAVKAMYWSIVWYLIVHHISIKFRYTYMYT